MNSLFKSLLGTNKTLNPISNLQKPQITIDINPKSPRKPKKSNTDVISKSQKKVVKKEEPITEKEIQVAIKRIKKIEAEARKRIVEEELKSQTHNKEVKVSSRKKQPIPNHIKTLIWNYWVSPDKAEAYCLCCKVTKISIRSFHAGHIVAESKGGDMTVKNLKPICGPCNLSMGSMNMEEFIKKFGLGK
jgi:hypothetical protein